MALLAGCTGLAPIQAGDPRFEACGGTVDTVQATLAFTARDYRGHLPSMGEAPELETDDPAFAVIFADGHAVPLPLHPGVRPRNDLAPPPDARHRTICIYVGHPPEGERHVYTNVDVATFP